MERKVQIKSIRDLGPQFTDNPHQMVGQDGAYSIPLPNGETLWFFGDTLIGRRVPGESIWYPGGKAVGRFDMSGKGSIRRMINNCGLITPAQNAASGIGEFRYILDDDGEIKTLIPHLPEEHSDEIRIWCQHGIHIGKTLYLFFLKMEMLDDGPLPVNFDFIGAGIAAGSTESWEFKRINDHGSDIFWDKTMPQFGSAVMLSRDHLWLYLYGVKKNDDLVQQSYLARVAVDNVGQPDKYQYAVNSEPNWSDNIDDARPVFEHPPNEQSVNFHPYLNCYLAVHSLDITGKIVLRTADHPWGPWSEPAVLKTIVPVRKKPLPYPPLVYAAKEHPALRRNGGKTMYITYVEFEEYFPHLLEVELV